MKKSIFFVQKKPLTVLVLGCFLSLLALYFLLTSSAPWSQIVVMGLAGMFILGYSTAFEISPEFKNIKHIRLFGISILRSSLDFKFPDYITVFSAKHKQSAEWGSVAAMGNERKGDSWVIRLFSGTAHFTVYRTSSLQDAKDRASELSTLLGVVIRGKNT